MVPKFISPPNTQEKLNGIANGFESENMSESKLFYKKILCGEQPLTQSKISIFHKWLMKSTLVEIDAIIVTSGSLDLYRRRYTNLALVN